VFKVRVAYALALLCVAVLSACGGGGGDTAGTAGSSNTGSSDLGRFNAVFTQSPVEAEGIEGTPEAVTLSARLGYNGNSNLYLGVEADRGVVLDVQGQVVGDTLNLTVTLRGDLAAGDHPTELLLHACVDNACSKEPSGSPVRVPIGYRVKPNLQVQQQVVLSRTGNDPSPSAALPVSIPAEAGPVIMQASNSRPDAIGLSFDGSVLQVQTQQVPTGSYAATVTLQSTTDRRYSRTVSIEYTVTAPAGGEQPLSIADGYRTVYLQQGGQSVQRLKVTRPTWTTAWDAPHVSDENNMLTLTDLGNDQYDATINTAGLALGQYSASVRFSAGPTGGTTYASFTVWVSAAFYLDGPTIHTLSTTSTTADLSWSNPVVMFDGSSAHWTAVSKTPLLHVLRSSGQTGLDALEISLDPAALTQADWGLALPVELSVDRPGTLPQTFQISVWNYIPALQHISPATLVGSSGRIYIRGAIRQYDTNLLQANGLRVNGATLNNAQMISDRRFVGDLSVLALDLTGATPGQPVAISVDNAVLPTQLQMQVQSPLRATAAYQALAYGSYRPGQFAQGLGALYFAGPDMVYRWAYHGSGWALSQSAVPGVIDVAPDPDDSALYAVDPSHLIALDPVTFAQRSVGTMRPGALPPDGFDSGAVSGMRAFMFSADGRALGSIWNTQYPNGHGVGWVCSGEGTRLVPALTASPGLCDPGYRARSIAGSTGAGLVRSANGHVVIGVDPDGARSIYRAAERTWVDAPKLPTGLLLAAVSDGGSRVVRSDGMLMDGTDTQLGNLGSAVPFSHVPGGYGLTSDGRFGIVYAYRISGEGSSQRATDATLWVLDLSNAAVAGVAAADVVATLSMPNAVGCTEALVAGETCQHTASISMAPGNGTAFVLGQRGVAAMPLPESVSAAQAQSARKAIAGARQTGRPSGTVRLPLQGSVKPR
jgi:hypothetical protein